MPDDALMQLTVKANVGEVSDGMAKAAADTEKSTQNMGNNFEQLEGKVERSEHSMLEAREAVRLLGEEIGLRMPRAVSTMIASIGPVGAALELAFPVLAVIALIDVIVEAVTKIGDLKEEANKTAEAWDKVSTTFDTSFDNLDKTLVGLESHLAEVTDGKVAGLEVGLRHIGTTALEVKKELDELFLATEEAAKDGAAGFLGYKDALRGIGEWYDEIKADIAPQAAEADKINQSFKNLKVSVDQAFATDAENHTHEALKLINGELETETDLLTGLQNLNTIGGASDEAVANQQKKVDYLVRANALAEEGAKIDDETKKDKNEELAVANAERLATVQKQILAQRLADIDEEKAKVHEQYEAGVVDLGIWLAAEVQAKTRATEANELYHAQLKSIYEEAGESEKADAAAKAFNTEQTKDLATETEALAAAQDKQREGLAKIIQSWNDILDKNVKKEWEEQSKAVLELSQAQETLLKSQENLNQAKGGEGNYQPQVDAIKEEVAQRILSKRQEAEQLKVIYREEEEAALASIQREIDGYQRVLSAAKQNQEQMAALYGAGSPQEVAAEAMYLKDEANFNELLTKKLNAEKQYNEKVAAEEAQLSQQMIKIQEKYFGEVNRDLNTLIGDWIVGHKKMGEVIEQMFAQGLVHLAQYVATWIEKKVEMWILDKILSDSAQDEEKAKTITSNVSQATSYAAVAEAAAAAGAAAVAGPGAPAAAAAAAAAMAAVMAPLVAQASAAEGFDVPGNLPGGSITTQLHPSEMVLPQEHADVIRSLAAASPSAGAGGGGTSSAAPATAPGSTTTTSSAGSSGMDIVLLTEIYDETKGTHHDTTKLVQAQELGAAFGASQLLMGSFAEGGIIPNTGPHLLHKDERVLSVQERNEYENLAPKLSLLQGKRSAGGGGEEEGRGGGGSSSTDNSQAFNYHDHRTVKSFDKSGVDDVMSKHASEIGKAARKAFKRGKVKMPRRA